MRGGTAAFVGLLSGVVACTGWVEEDALAVPEAPIEAPLGFRVVPTEPAPTADEPTEHEVHPTRDPGPRCTTTMEYMESEDGTTPRQRAMFAPEIERRPWATMREWFARAGVSLPEEAGMYAFGANELGRALGDPSAHYDCARIVELAGRESAVCTRSAIVAHAEVRGREVLAVDWVIVLATADGLVPVTVGPHADGGIAFDTPLEPPLPLLPYVRLDLVVVDAARGRVRIEEAAPGVCDYACAHAMEVERRNVGGDPLAARETAEIAATCGAIGTYVLRGTKVERERARG
jgi:hypothetical protein